MNALLATTTSTYTGLEIFWFVVIAILWCGYFVLDGFDFGVGLLLPVVGRDEVDRRVLINTIGPVWDANEVWLLVAGGATFAAFPNWYATMFSGFYLPLFFVLVALIFRGVAFEFRAKRAFPKWRLAWDHAIFWGSLVPALLFGVAFANILRGVPIAAGDTYLGSFFNLLNPYALAGWGHIAPALHAARRGLPVPKDHRRHPRARHACRQDAGPGRHGGAARLPGLDLRQRPQSTQHRDRAANCPGAGDRCCGGRGVAAP